MDVRSARLQEKGFAAGADTFCPPPPPPPHPPPRQPSRAAGGGGSSVLSSPPRRARLLPAWSTPPPLSSLPPLPPARPSQLSRVSGWATRGGGWRGRPREVRPCPRGPGPTDARGAPRAPSGLGRPGRQGGPGGIGGRLERGPGAASPTSLSHFLGILPLVFISLRRKLGLKRKKEEEEEKERKNNNNPYSSGETQDSGTMERQLAFVPRHLGSCLLSPAAGGRGGFARCRGEGLRGFGTDPPGVCLLRAPGPGGCCQPAGVSVL